MLELTLSGRRPGLLGAVLFLALLFGSAALGLTSPAVQGESSRYHASSAVSVFLLRHAEKARDDPRDPTLNEAGRARAREVQRVFASAGVTHLFSTDFKRTLETLGPLAQVTGLEITSYDPGEVAESLRSLPTGSVAVVAGHSNTTPALYRALGAGEARDLVDSRHGKLIPDGDYDRLYCVTLAAGDGDEFECISGLELRYGAPSSR